MGHVAVHHVCSCKAAYNLDSIRFRSKEILRSFLNPTKTILFEIAEPYTLRTDRVALIPGIRTAAGQS